jgi:hypothetical protein
MWAVLCFAVPMPVCLCLWPSSCCARLCCVQSNSEGLDLVVEAIAKAGYTGKVVIGMDVAASEFYTADKVAACGPLARRLCPSSPAPGSLARRGTSSARKQPDASLLRLVLDLSRTRARVPPLSCPAQMYDLDFKTPGNDGSAKLSGAALTDLYKEFLAKYPVISIEDPFDQVGGSGRSQRCGLAAFAISLLCSSACRLCMTCVGLCVCVRAAVSVCGPTQDDWETYAAMTADVGGPCQVCARTRGGGGDGAGG